MALNAENGRLEMDGGSIRSVSSASRCSASAGGSRIW